MIDLQEVSKAGLIFFVCDDLLYAGEAYSAGRVGLGCVLYRHERYIWCQLLLDFVS